MLGMTLKSLTSSRKIIDIIHRYGHCISYPEIEELETEATYTSIKKSSLYPETIKKSSNLCTGVVYDNFDRFVEIRSGKDTLHNTVGIISQNVDLNAPDVTEISNPTSPNDEETLNKKKKKTENIEAVSLNEITYPKKPRMTDDLQLSPSGILFSLQIIFMYL